MFDEAQRRNPGGKRRNVVLVDGDEKQIERVEAEAEKRSMPITLVLDLIHVIHYLWTIALLLCGGAHKEADAWVGHILVHVLTRHPLDVVATIRHTATLRRLNAADRAALDAALDYLNKNWRYIHYAEFLADGLPLPPASLRAPAATWFKTEWGSPAHDGGLVRARAEIMEVGQSGMEIIGGGFGLVAHAERGRAGEATLRAIATGA
jgi:hypothetical protein